VAIRGGSLIPSVGAATGSPVSSIGVKTQSFVAESVSSGIIFTPTSSDFTCTIDNISLYKLEDKLCLITDYDNTSEDIRITFIARVTDCSKYPPSFINALAFRLAAEISIPITESLSKFNGLSDLYEKALLEADSVNQSNDYIEDEQGKSTWVNAGRG